MSTVDFDNDGNFDGIINLYDEYSKATGEILDQGLWSIDNSLSLPLDENTGQVSLWEYQFSSASNQVDYTYVLTTDSCGTIPAVSITIELGSFSGVALPPSGTNDINFESCEGVIDLYETLVSNATIPSPHLNGTWELINSATNGNATESTISNNLWDLSINYQEGLPLIDKGEFEFRYVMPITENCLLQQETNVKISIVRQVQSGISEDLSICESEILNGDYDTSIDLTNNRYLIDEDIEGFWSSDNADTTGEISDVFDSEVNFKTLYDDLILTEGKRFGFQNFVFRYTVPQRSGVCDDRNSEVLVTIFEELRPFNQNTNNNGFCLNDTETVDLFDFLEFTKEDGIDFVYANESFFTNWTSVSGPSGTIDLDASTGVFDVNNNGTLAIPGTYVFQYTVNQFVNSEEVALECAGPGSHLSSFYNEEIARAATCTNQCQELSTLITINVLPFDYAGEDNTDIIEFCETETSVLLTSLLEGENQFGPIASNGIWTNAEGIVFDNNFVFPEVDTDTEFDLTYTTTHPVSNCIDTSQLKFTIINETSPGSTGESIHPNGIVRLCTDDLSIVLFDQLQNADIGGQWTGPNNYRSANHEGRFVFNNQTQQDIVEGEYVYTIGDGLNCTTINTTVVSIQFEEPVQLAGDIAQTYCKSVGSIDLISLLEVSSPKNGLFEDLDSIGRLTGSVFDFSTLSTGVYNFRYSLDLTPCDSPSQNIIIEVIDDVIAPSAGIPPIEPIRICADNLSIKLFDQLEGNPSISGEWTGDFGYSSNGSHEGLFVDGDVNLPILGSGTYTYTVDGGECNDLIDTSTVTIEIIEPIELGEDVFASFCKIEAGVNLFSLLDENTTVSGQFTELGSSNNLAADGFLNFGDLPGGVYNFEYSIPNEAPCEVSSLNVEIRIIELARPFRVNSEFCILNANKLEDISVFLENAEEPLSNTEINWYTSLQSESPIINNPILFDDDVYYVSQIDAQDCESDRFQVTVNILNIGEVSEINSGFECPIEFQDGVSADGNNVNDTFSLDWTDVGYNVNEAFPNYELEIFNRYGVVVYKGNSNTSEFDGESNVSLSIGNDLPTGVYYYIFSPNFKNNSPIQGSFYLSK